MTRVETITNDIPEIETYAESKGEKEDTKITENAVITDTVKYKDLKPGETYLLTGRLMDRKTGEAVKNSKGEIIVSQKEDSMIHLGVKMPVGVQLGYKGGFWHKKNPANVDLQGIKKAAPTGFEPVFQP